MKTGRETWRRKLAATGLASALLLACSHHASKSPDPEAGGATSTLPDGSVSCTNDARLDAYSAGLEKPGLSGALRFRLEKSEPAPPAKGDNTFTVSVSNESGQAITGDLSVKLKMPDHGHESPTVPVITFDADSATYTLKPVNLFMAGVWQITFSAYEASADAGAPLDSVSFFFCVEG